MTLEFILALPILVIVSFASVEFGILALAQQAVTAATIEGAREAAKIGSTHDDIAGVVQSYLAIHNVTFDTTGTTGGDARVVIEHPTLGSAERGNTAIPCTASGPGTLAADQVRVTVCVLVTNGTGQPVPNLLSTFGLTLADMVFEISAIEDLEE